MCSFNDPTKSDFRMINIERTDQIYLHKNVISEIPYFQSYFSNIGKDKDYIETEALGAAKVIFKAYYDNKVIIFNQEYWKDIVDFVLMWELLYWPFKEIIWTTCINLEKLLEDYEDLEFYYIRIKTLCKLFGCHE